MRQTATSESILDPTLYADYAGQWLNKISEQDNPDLTSYFNDGSGNRVTYAEFSIQRIIELVSAVGVRQIKARFVLLPGQGDDQLLFSLVLFATDADDRQLSAYYLPDSTAATSSLPAERVPGGLAGLWEEYWKTEATLTTAMFKTSYGPLEGYNFDIKDFLAPLFTGTTSYTNQQVRLKLGLHQYIAADTTTLTQTFGLVVRRFDGDQQVQGAAADDYDMSTPCPPTH